MNRTRPIASPNLPQGRVTLCVMSGKYPQLCRRMEELGVEVLRSEALKTLAEPVAFHGDLQLCHLGDNRIILDPGAGSLTEALGRRGFQCRATCRPVTKAYPGDVRLGMLLLAPFCFGNMESAAPEVLVELLLDDWELVSSRQGYAKCSVCVAGEGITITADPTLAELLTAKGLQCLSIPPGDIVLEGYDTGFLGGCCGLLAPDTLAFTGNLEHYREGKPIEEYLRKNGIHWISLSDGPMVDIGGILPLMEEYETFV